VGLDVIGKGNTTWNHHARVHTPGHTKPVYNYMLWGSFWCQKSEQV